MSSRPRRPPPGRQRRPPPGRQRRSLSMARAGGRIEHGGDDTLGRGAAEALAAANRPRDDRDTGAFTHGVHSYPARMHPATARGLIQLLAGTGRAGGARAALLDPFTGSGTSLIEARAAGLAALGTDLNPLAVAIARAVTWTAPRSRRLALARTGARLAAEALAQVKAARRAGHVTRPRRRVGRDPVARDRELGEWFAPHVRRELETLAGLIDQVERSDDVLAAHLRVVLSSILHKVSSRASDTDPSKVVRQVARGAAARLFAARVELLCRGLDQLARSTPGPMPRVVECDARRLGDVTGPERFDLVVTSPPYAGTYDYAAHHRLRMVFLGLDQRGLERGEIGARAQFRGAASQRARALANASRDMGAALGQMHRALRPGGRAALVVGDSLAGRRAVRADRLVTDALAAANLGGQLELEAWAWQERPQLGAAERAAFAGGPPKREHILILVRR